jgi:hypothetical protein
LKQVESVELDVESENSFSIRRKKMEGIKVRPQFSRESVLLGSWIHWLVKNRKVWESSRSNPNLPFTLPAKEIVRSCILKLEEPWARPLLDEIQKQLPSEMKDNIGIKVKHLLQAKRDAANISAKKSKKAKKKFVAEHTLEFFQDFLERKKQQPMIEASQQEKSVVDEPLRIPNTGWTFVNVKHTSVGLLPNGTFPNLSLPLELDGEQEVLEYQRQQEPAE